MSPITRILVGLFVAALGFLMVYKTQWFMSAVGSISFAEKWFGGGGTRLFYKLSGVLLACLGFIMVTNLFQALFGNFLTNLFHLG